MGKFDGLRYELNIFYKDTGEPSKAYLFNNSNVAQYVSRSYFNEPYDTATSFNLKELYSIVKDLELSEFKDKEYNVFLIAFDGRALAFDMQISKTDKKYIIIHLGHKSNFTELGIKRYLGLREE